MALRNAHAVQYESGPRTTLRLSAWVVGFAVHSVADLLDLPESRDD